MKTKTPFLEMSSGRPYAALIALALMLPVLSAMGQASITLSFSTPDTRSSQTLDFSGGFTVNPANMSVTPTVTGGGTILASGPTLNGTGSGRTVALSRLPRTSGTVSVRLDGVSGTNTTSRSFQVIFPPNAPPSLVNVQEADVTETSPGVLVTNYTVVTAITFDEDAGVFAKLNLGDADTPTNLVTLTVSSLGLSDSNLIDTLQLGGTGLARTLLVRPQANKHGTGTIRLVVADQESSVTNDLALTVTSVDDRSTTEVGSVPTMGDNVPNQVLFTNAVVEDVDLVTDEFTVSVLVGPGLGTLSYGGTTGVTTLMSTGTRTQLSSFLEGLTFSPVPNRTQPGTSTSLTVVVLIEDTAAVSNATSRAITILSVNDAPQVVSGIQPQPVLEGATARPFFITSISDLDVEDNLFALTVQLTSPAQSNLVSFIGSASSGTRNEAGIRTFIQNLAIQTTPNVISTASEVVNFRYIVTDGFGGATTNTHSLTITAEQFDPTIFGILAETRNLTDRAIPFVPFPTVSVADADGVNELLTATLTLSRALGTFSESAFSAQTASSLTLALRAVRFTPTPGVLPINTTADTVLTITVTDSTGRTVGNSNLTLAIKAVNNPPSILGVPSIELQPLLLTNPLPPYLPFAALGLTNDDTNAVTVQVSLDVPEKGTLSTNAAGFVLSAPGTYTMTGSTAAISNALTQLTFTLSGTYNFPVDDPGGTTFTITAADFALLTSLKKLYIQVQDAPRNHLVTRTANDGLPGSFTYALANAGNNDVITFALPVYPAIVRLPGSAATLLDRNLSIKGPGADLLTLSGDGNGDTVADRQLFRVQSRVSIEGLTLTHGTAAFGGAIQVLSQGDLTLRDCAVVDSEAASYGGAIDVDGGKLTVERCFIGRNRLHADTGMSGAGISIYTDQEVRIVNSTFSQNVQANENGDGGGALVVENLDPGSPTPQKTYLTHCTFSQNEDAAGKASAVLSISFGTWIHPRNCVFMDQSERNLNVSNSGEIISLGGNICDDSTRTAHPRGGTGPRSVFCWITSRI